MNEVLMTAEDVRAYINVVSIRTIYRKAETGELPCYRIGRQIRFKKCEIDEAMKGGKNAKKADTRSRSYLART